MNKSYKYKLLPTKEQSILIKNHCFNANQAYNILLSLYQKEYQENQLRKANNEEPEYFSNTDKDRLVKQFLKERLLKVNTKVLQQERIRFNQNFFSNIKKISNGNNDIGHLKFKKYSHNSYQSFQTTKEQYKIIDCVNNKYKILRLFNQSIKIRWTRELPSEPKSITISFDSNNFHIVFNVNEEKKINNRTIKSFKGKLTKNNSIAIDINNNSIDYGSNKYNHKKIDINQLKDYDKTNKNIKKFQKKQSKRIEKLKKSNKEIAVKSKETNTLKVKNKEDKHKLGKNYYKTQKKINKLNKKIVNQRNYRLHQMTNSILNFVLENKIKNIIVEDLNVKKMTTKTTNDNKIKLLGKNKTKSMKKNILNISYSEFLNMLSWKCEQYGIQFNKINPKNTSKTCSKCKNIKEKLELSERMYSCEKCDNIIDRDYNACLNILDKYFSKTVETTGLVQIIN